MGSLVQIQSPRPFFSSDYGRASAGGAPAPRRPAARKTMSVVLLTNDDGVHSIAVSLVDGGDFDQAARVARLLALRVLVVGLPRKTLLNVNVPATAPRGIRITRLGHRVYSGKIVEQVDPRGRSHYWIGG